MTVNPLPSHYDDHFVILRAQRLQREWGSHFSALLRQPLSPDQAVTVVIPARNEAATIADVIKECFLYVGAVLVVDGRSTDGTPDIAKALGAQVIFDHGLGKGAAMVQAIEEVKTPITVFVDADGSHDPIDIPILVAPLHKGVADHVTGSRLLGGSDELHGGSDEFLRLAGSAFITYMINRRFGVKLSDSQNGFRSIRTAVFKKLSLRSHHTTIEMEMIMTSLAYGYRVCEVPTHERPRAAGYSKISLSNPWTWWSYGWTLLRGITQTSATKNSLI